MVLTTKIINKVKQSEVARSCPTPCDPMDAVYQAPLSLGFSRQEYWSGLPFPSPGDLPNIGIKPAFPVSPPLQVDSLLTEPSGKPSNSVYLNI